jgi:demethylmenaquinone methyltransferase/2-methoxy-6-polyprenyl-1,4-benzoquinol methylase
MEKKYRDAGMDLLLAQEGERILEIGFGTGHCLLGIARAVGPSGRVYGLDLSQGMAGIATKRLQKASLLDRVDVQVGDAAFLPQPPASLDAVFMSFTLELFDTPEIPVVLEQCWKVLRKGGRIVVVAMGQPTKPGAAVRIYEWLHAHMPAAVDCRPIPAGRMVEEAGFLLSEKRSMWMWGLLVEIIRADKVHPVENR